MRRNQRHGVTVTLSTVTLSTVTLAVLLGLVAFIGAPIASAQDTNEIVRALDADGYYIESGADATDAEMQRLVTQSASSQDQWYFVVLAGSADFEYAADLRDQVRTTGNVLVASVEEDSQGFFDQVDFATGTTESIEEQSLVAFDGDWDRPADYMSDVIREFNSLTSSTASSGSSAGSSSSGSSSSGSSSSNGGGFPWALVAVPAAIGGGIWFVSRRGKKKRADVDRDTAQKIRTELQTELDELANDVLVLSGPVDLSDKPDAVNFYREATNTYLDISNEIPDPEKLDGADLQELSKIGVRVAHARWQMDAAEALIDGEPVPEKPKVELPPPPQPAPQQEQRREQQRQQMPTRAPRPRVPYSGSRRRSGGGLLDVLIAGAGMMGASRGRRSSGMFGGSSSRSRQSSPRAGGGVFGGGSRSSTSSRSARSSGSSRSRSSSSRSSRSSSRRSSARRSTSKRRRR